MFHRLVQNRYGKSRIRLLKVRRRGDLHDLKDLAVTVQFEGDYEPTFVVGDNTKVLPTDTMRNTVYALARQHPLEDIEPFALALAEHFIADGRVVSRVRIEIAEHLWKRLSVGEKPQAQAFLLPGHETRTAVVSRTRDEVTIEAGVDGLVVLKSGHSAFAGFLHDEYTTLKDTSDRIFATAITASWTYGSPVQPFGPSWAGIRQLLLETFAQHESLSVQHTLYAMGELALESYESIDEIRFSLPNRHHLLVDLSPFHLENQNEIFVPTDEPFGLIQATIRRRAES